MDISHTEPKSGCCKFHQDPCSLLPLPGPTRADFLCIQEKEAL